MAILLPAAMMIAALNQSAPQRAITMSCNLSMTVLESNKASAIGTVVPDLPYRFTFEQGSDVAEVWIENRNRDTGVSNPRNLRADLVLTPTAATFSWVAGIDHSFSIDRRSLQLSGDAIDRGMFGPMHFRYEGPCEMSEVDSSQNRF